MTQNVPITETTIAAIHEHMQSGALTSEALPTTSHDSSNWPPRTNTVPTPGGRQPRRPTCQRPRRD
jgi:hypothetical protein